MQLRNDHPPMAWIVEDLLFTQVSPLRRDTNWVLYREPQCVHLGQVQTSVALASEVTTDPLSSTMVGGRSCSPGTGITLYLFSSALPLSTDRGHNRVTLCPEMQLIIVSQYEL